MKEKADMDPVKVKTSTGVYGAPLGEEGRIGGLPFWRSHDPLTGRTTVYSAWKPDADEVKALQLGGTVILGILGMEPIPPVSLGVAWKGRHEDDTPNPAADDPRAVVVESGVPLKDGFGRTFIDPEHNNQAE